MELVKKIELLETMIAIYSDRDRVRMIELEKELYELNMQLLDEMTEKRVA